jgi:hypothetical protein
MASDLVVLDSARKRGYLDVDLIHVVVWAVRVARQDDGMTMYIGPDAAGRFMEVGTVILKDGRRAIAHAMCPPRSKYLARKNGNRR